MDIKSILGGEDNPYRYVFMPPANAQVAALKAVTMVRDGKSVGIDPQHLELAKLIASGCQLNVDHAMWIVHRLSLDKIIANSSGMNLDASASFDDRFLWLSAGGNEGVQAADKFLQSIFSENYDAWAKTKKRRKCKTGKACPGHNVCIPKNRRCGGLKKPTGKRTRKRGGGSGGAAAPVSLRGGRGGGGSTGATQKGGGGSQRTAKAKEIRESAIKRAVREKRLTINQAKAIKARNFGKTMKKASLQRPPAPGKTTKKTKASSSTQKKSTAPARGAKQGEANGSKDKYTRAKGRVTKKLEDKRGRKLTTAEKAVVERVIARKSSPTTTKKATVSKKTKPASKPTKSTGTPKIETSKPSTQKLDRLIAGDSNSIKTLNKLAEEKTGKSLEKPKKIDKKSAVETAKNLGQFYLDMVQYNTDNPSNRIKKVGGIPEDLYSVGVRLKELASAVENGTKLKNPTAIAEAIGYLPGSNETKVYFDDPKWRGNPVKESINDLVSLYLRRTTPAEDKALHDLVEPRVRSKKEVWAPLKEAYDRNRAAKKEHRKAGTGQPFKPSHEQPSQNLPSAYFEQDPDSRAKPRVTTKPDTDPKPTKTPNLITDPKSVTLKQLKPMAKELGIRGYSKLKKAELIKAINEKRSAGTTKPKPTPSKGTDKTPPETQDLTKLTVKKLKPMAKEAGVRGYSRMRKAELIKAIENKRSDGGKETTPPPKPDDSKPGFDPKTGKIINPKKVTVKQLKPIAKTLGVKSYSKMKKAELIKAINGKRDGSEIVPPKPDPTPPPKPDSKPTNDKTEKLISEQDALKKEIAQLKKDGEDAITLMQYEHVSQMYDNIIADSSGEIDPVKDFESKGEFSQNLDILTTSNQIGFISAVPSEFLPENYRGIPRENMKTVGDAYSDLYAATQKGDGEYEEFINRDIKPSTIKALQYVEDGSLTHAHINKMLQNFVDNKKEMSLQTQRAAAELVDQGYGEQYPLLKELSKDINKTIEASSKAAKDRQKKLIAEATKERDSVAKKVEELKAKTPKLDPSNPKSVSANRELMKAQKGLELHEKNVELLSKDLDTERKRLRNIGQIQKDKLIEGHIKDLNSAATQAYLGDNKYTPKTFDGVDLTKKENANAILAGQLAFSGYADQTIKTNSLLNSFRKYKDVLQLYAATKDSGISSLYINTALDDSLESTSRKVDDNKEVLAKVVEGTKNPPVWLADASITLKKIRKFDANVERDALEEDSRIQKYGDDNADNIPNGPVESVGQLRAIDSRIGNLRASLDDPKLSATQKATIREEIDNLEESANTYADLLFKTRGFRKIISDTMSRRKHADGGVEYSQQSNDNSSSSAAMDLVETEEAAGIYRFKKLVVDVSSFVSKNKKAITYSELRELASDIGVDHLNAYLKVATDNDLFLGVGVNEKNRGSFRETWNGDRYNEYGAFSLDKAAIKESGLLDSENSPTFENEHGSFNARNIERIKKDAFKDIGTKLSQLSVKGGTDVDEWDEADYEKGLEIMSDLLKQIESVAPRTTTDKEIERKVNGLKISLGKNSTAAERQMVRNMATSYFKMVDGIGLKGLEEFKKTDSRAYANKGRRYINVGGASKRTLFHEMGHFTEFELDELEQSNRSWVRSQAQGMQQQIYPDTNPRELGYKIGPGQNSYTLKEYTSKGTEVFSMGIQSFHSRGSMLEAYAKWPEHFQRTTAALIAMRQAQAEARKQ